MVRRKRNGDRYRSRSRQLRISSNLNSRFHAVLTKAFDRVPSPRAGLRYRILLAWLRWPAGGRHKYTRSKWPEPLREMWGYYAACRRHILIARKPLTSIRPSLETTTWSLCTSRQCSSVALCIGKEDNTLSPSANALPFSVTEVSLCSVHSPVQVVMGGVIFLALQDPRSTAAKRLPSGLLPRLKMAEVGVSPSSNSCSNSMYVVRVGEHPTAWAVWHAGSVFFCSRYYSPRPDNVR